MSTATCEGLGRRTTDAQVDDGSHNPGVIGKGRPSYTEGRTSMRVAAPGRGVTVPEVTEASEAGDDVLTYKVRAVWLLQSR